MAQVAAGRYRKPSQISPNNNRAMVQNGALSNALSDSPAAYTPEGPTAGNPTGGTANTPPIMGLNTSAMAPPASQPTAPPTTTTSTPPANTGGAVPRTTPTAPTTPSVSNPTGAPAAAPPTPGVQASQQLAELKRMLTLARERMGRDLTPDEIKAVTGMDASQMGGSFDATTWDVPGAEATALGMAQTAGYNPTNNPVNPGTTPPGTTPPGGTSTPQSRAALTTGDLSTLRGFNYGAWGSGERGTLSVKNTFGKIASRYPPTPQGLRDLVNDPDFKANFPNARLVEGGAGDKIDFGGVLSDFESGVPVGVVDVGLAFDPRNNSGSGWWWGHDAGGGAAGGGTQTPVVAGSGGGATTPGQAGPSVGATVGSNDYLQQLIAYVQGQLRANQGPTVPTGPGGVETPPLLLP